MRGKIVIQKRYINLVGCKSTPLQLPAWLVQIKLPSDEDTVLPPFTLVARSACRIIIFGFF